MLDSIVIYSCLYAILAMSANLTVGKADLLTLCQAAFYGVGAYIGAFFLMRFHLPFVITALIVMIVTGLSSLIVSYASIRLKGDYFILASLSFQIVIFSIMNNWTSATGGADGLTGIPSISILGIWKLPSRIAVAIFSLIITAAIFLLLHKETPYMRLLKAIKDDDRMVQTLGRNVFALKTGTFFLSAAIAGIAGLIFATYHHYIDPSSFALSESIMIITAVFIGGCGNWKGSVLGAIIIVVLPELIQKIGFDMAVTNNLKQIIYGLILILMMVFRPEGILSETKKK